MKKSVFLIPLFLIISLVIQAQGYNTVHSDGTFNTSDQNHRKARNDSLNKNQEAPRGLKVWSVSSDFGDITPEEPDTMAYLYMNTIFTSGLYGEYNTTGNLGAARESRIYMDRELYNDFIFNEKYDYFNTNIDKFHFTNTYSPITNLSLNTCGNRTNGEDHFKALFAVNAGKRIGVGFKIDYLYGRGYYSENSASLFNYTMWGSYLGDRYQAHLLMYNNHQKQAENGGIINDRLITHPESFDDNYSASEIPTMLQDNWNRNDNQRLFLTHRYSLGFNRKVPMTEEEIKARKFAIESQKENAAAKAKEVARRKAVKEDGFFDEEEYDRQVAYNKEHGLPQTWETNQPIDTTWTKNEYVPVTSFIHTLDLQNYRRIYQSYYTPKDYYANNYATVSRFSNDSIYDKTTHFRIKNTFAIALLEGFNKYAKAGFKGFIAHDLKHYTLPDSTTMERGYNEHTLYAGGQISKHEGKTLHYDAKAEFGIAGEDIGDIMVDGNTDLNFRLFNDSIHLAASGFFHLTTASFYFNTYHSRHFWWDHDFDKTIHSRIQGDFSLDRTHTRLRVAIDDLEKYVYFANSYTVNEKFNRLNNSMRVVQYDGNLSVFTAQLAQDFRLGPLNFETIFTYQKSSKKEIIPLPDLNIWANLYLRFKIAHVLDCDLGADVRYFTKYEAPDFVPGMAQFAVQENPDSRVKIGGYPFVNAYANFFLGHTRFFVMMSHVNYSGSGGNYFLVPHYPTNQRIFRFGVSWNFFN
ncbi:MAG: putative porin [Prevotella sp.]|nr:putative porin [Prevotella sp.]